MYHVGTTIPEIPSIVEFRQDDQPSPNRVKPPPSYVEITKMKLVDSSDSSDEDSIEHLSKNLGRKSRNEAREEEAERLKM